MRINNLLIKKKKLNKIIINKDFKKILKNSLIKSFIIIDYNYFKILENIIKIKYNFYKIYLLLI